MAIALAIAAPLALSVPAGSVTSTPSAALTVTSTAPPIAEGWQSLTCPTSTTCLGLAYTAPGSDVLERSTNGGVSFTYTLAPQAANETQIACATSRFCLMAGPWGGPGYPATGYLTVNGGTTWRQMRLPGSAAVTSYEVGVGCSTTTCFLVTTSNKAPLLLAVTASSTSWSTVTLPNTPDAAAYLSGVSCGGGRCVVIGTTTNSTQGLVFESDQGGTWSEVLAPAPGFTISSMQAVACSAYACAAYGSGSGQGALLSSTSSGSWVALVTSGADSARSISCTPVRCLAVGGNWIVGGLDAWTLTGLTPSWTSITTPHGEGGQVFTSSACSAARCVAGTNRLYDLSNSGAAWTTAKSVNGESGYTDIQCPTPSICVAGAALGDGRTATRTSRDGGIHWGAVRPVEPYESFVTGSSCVGVMCAMDGYNESTNAGWFSRSMDDGSHWSLVKEPSYGDILRSVACPTPQICIAAVGWGLGLFARTTNGGHSWTEVHAHLIGSKGTAVSIDCYTSTRCVAVGATYVGVDRLVSNNAGVSWSYGKVSSQVLGYSSLTCVPAGVCLLTGLSSSNKFIALRSTTGGLRWARAGAPPDRFGGATHSASTTCWSAHACEVVFGGSANSLAFVTANTGRTWSKVTTPAGVAAIMITCGTDRSCVASGERAGIQAVLLHQSRPKS